MNKRIVSLPMLASCAALTLALVQPAFAAGTAPAAAPACAAVSAETLNNRVPSSAIPALAGLKDGACVTLSKAASGLADAWTGAYIYHPAGSVVPLTAMYVRWQDGFVMVRWNQDGVLVAHVNIAKPLEWAGESGILALPDTGTWILRDLGNGKFQALVDVFEYQSGDIGPIVFD